MREKRSRLWLWISLGAAWIVSVMAYTQLTIFVLQPIGAVRDGQTVILWRQSAALQFVDSADAICLRTQNGVSQLCRVAALAGVMEHNTIIVRLPYSRWLYLRSTGGQEFDR